MMTPSTILSLDDYGFEGFDELESPRLLVYERFARENLARLREELEAIAPGSGFRHLRPHAKTHKSAWATELQISEGIERFKCTPHELDMLLEAHAHDVFVAYPPLPPLADRIAERQARYPDCRIASQVAAIEHAEALAKGARRHAVELDVFLDLDVGAARTGIPPRDVVGFARSLLAHESSAQIRIVGLHAYDGHNHSADAAERSACARDAMRLVIEVLEELTELVPTVKRLCVGGSPGSLPCLETLVKDHGLSPDGDLELEVSPGTFIYWDTKYEGLMPGRFRLAALLFARVMDRPTADRITLDLGHKRWAIDQGPVDRFSEAGLEVVATSEEHTVLRCEDSSRFVIGQPILIAPRHVCPTINLWEEFLLVQSDGTIEDPPHAVTARNR